jgi:hypothetical protein
MSSQWQRPISPAIVEHLAERVATSDARHKSLMELCNDRFEIAMKQAPTSMSEQERFLWRMGFAEGMSVVLDYIKSGSPK